MKNIPSILGAFLGTLTLLTLTACSPAAPESPTAGTAKGNPAPTPATPDSEAQQAALLKGKEITAEVGKSLSSVLLAAIQEGGPTNAIPLCSVQAVPLTSNLANKHGVSIRRVSHRARNPANRASESEIQIIRKYQDQKDAGSPLQPMIQPGANGSLTFYAPIAIATNLCLNCHGVPGDTLVPGIAEAVAKLYAEDQATGFQLGDLRGLWRVDFPPAFIAKLSPQEPANP